MTHDLAAPMVNAHVTPARIELHPIRTVTLSGQQFLTGQGNGEPTLLAGELRLPAGGIDPFPAVLLLHGSGGTRANIDLWAGEFNTMGVASFILDAFTGRGITATSHDQTQLHELAMLYDAYRALERLALHPRIDRARIAIMGFSKGAVAAVYSSLTRFQRMHGCSDARFAAHIGMYTPCNTTYIEDTITDGTPIRLFHGTADDLCVVGPCRDYVERLKRAGCDAQITEYPQAWHNFDLPGPPLNERKGPNRALCLSAEQPDGQIFNRETGKPFSWQDRCVANDAHTGYDAHAHALSVKDVRAFLAQAFGLY